MHRVDRPMAGEELFLSQLDVIERVIAFVCARHHLPAADADDFGSHVKLRFVESDYAVLSKFEGRSSLKTFLAVVINRWFLDYRISAWGKWRPSAEARRLGPVAVQLELLLSRDGHTLDEAREILKTTHGVDASRADLDRLAARLPARTKRTFESDDVLTRVPAEGAEADRLVGDDDRKRMADRVSAVLADHMQQLDPQDRVILAMRFEDGRTVADIASALRLPQKPLYRRVEDLLRGLRRALESRGVQAADVFEMFENPAVSLDWTGRRETAPARPSLVKADGGRS